MGLANDLLRAPHLGVRDLRNHFSDALKENDMLVVTEHGHPTRVLIPYEEMLEIIDLLDELKDREVMKTVMEGKKAVKEHSKGIPVSKLFKKIRARIEKQKK